MRAFKETWVTPQTVANDATLGPLIRVCLIHSDICLALYCGIMIITEWNCVSFSSNALLWSSEAKLPRREVWGGRHRLQLSSRSATLNVSVSLVFVVFLFFKKQFNLMSQWGRCVIFTLGSGFDFGFGFDWIFKLCSSSQGFVIVTTA